MEAPEYIATEAVVSENFIHILLLDGSRHSVPTLYYPRLAEAEDSLLAKVSLRVGGRALRWEELDEDIWVADAVLGKYPAPRASVAA